MGSVRVRRGGEHGNGDSLQWGQVHSGKGRMNMGVMRKDKGEAGGGACGGGEGARVLPGRACRPLACHMATRREKRHLRTRVPSTDYDHGATSHMAWSPVPGPRSHQLFGESLPSPDTCDDPFHSQFRQLNMDW